MPIQWRKILWLVGLGTFGALTAAARPSVEEAEGELRRMPSGYRRYLTENLRAFQALPSAESSKLRDLDQNLAETDPEIENRYRTVLRRYTRWYRSLDEASRDQLDSTAPDNRIPLVRRLLRNRPQGPGNPLDEDLARFAKLASASILDQAYRVQCWLSLSPTQRTAVSNARGEERRGRLEAFGRENQVPDRRSKLAIPLDQNSDRAEGDGVFDPIEPEAVEPWGPQLAEARFLRGFTPTPVDPTNLSRFLATVPTWALDSFDDLPALAARARLALLYRLVFPAPAEVTDAADDEEPTEPVLDEPPAESTQVPPPDSRPFASPF